MSKFEESMYGKLPDDVPSPSKSSSKRNRQNDNNKIGSNGEVGNGVVIFDSAWLNQGLTEARKLRRLRRIEQEISLYLVEQFRGELGSQARQQSLFSLLGVGFVQAHFPHHKFDPGELDQLDPLTKARSLEEARVFVDDKVRKGLEVYLANSSGGLDKKLVDEIREIFSSDMNAEIHKMLVGERKIKIRHGKKGRTKIEELEDTVPDRIKFLEITLMDMLKHSPETNELALRELTSRVLILPTAFRQQLFDKLYLADVMSMGGEEERTRQKRAYAEQAKHRLQQIGLSRVGDWSGRKAIDASVIVAYERSPALKEEIEVTVNNGDDGGGVDDKLVFYTRILSLRRLLDNDSFSPTHIFWLVHAGKYFPEETAASSDKGNSSDSRTIHFAYHFERFSRVAVPMDRQIFSLANEAFATLEREEPDLVGRLVSAMQEGVAGAADPTLYSQAILCEDPDRGAETVRHFLKYKKVEERDLELFSDFRILFRKWISEAFVCCLSRNMASLVWDFLFIHRFVRPKLVGVCLALFNLLKPLLQQAVDDGNGGDFAKIQGVMTQGPKMLLIRDMRRVLQHLAKGGQYGDIPAAPNVPRVMIIPPSAREERRSRDRRIEATINMDLLEADPED